jgi:endonuclease/exonuclease/phosphatase family metal-dependent hydrolase
MDVGGGDLLAFLEGEAELSCEGAESRASDGFPHLVVLLQEAFRRSTDLPVLDDPNLAARRKTHDPHPEGDLDITGIADLCGLALLYVPSGRNGVDRPGERPADKGNAILSTLPLSDFLAVVHPYETERKVGVAATIPLPQSGSLRLVNTHLEVTATLHRALLTGNQTRLRQVNGLLEALEIHETEGGASLPTLMAGDFNTWSGGESALKRLHLAFPDSPSWDRESTAGPFPADHLFFRRASVGEEHGTGVSFVVESYRRIDHDYSSDHRARFGWIRFGHPGPPPHPE